MLQAALGYARSGWRIFPCRPKREVFTGRDGTDVVLKEKEPLVGKDKDPISGKPIKGSGGLAKATTDEEQIKAWWKKWPDALIGAVTGSGMNAFVVDFDIIDKETGEVFVLEDRIKALEDAIGTTLPETAMAMTASGGCHLYFALPTIPDGLRLGNSNKRLPFKIDIRGDNSGYVIVPPSRRTDMGDEPDDGRYYWEKRLSQFGVAPAPQGLLDLLFVPVKGAKVAKSDRPAVTSRTRSTTAASSAEEEAVRKYGDTALAAECRAVREAPSGQRNDQLNESALKIASLTVSVPIAALEATWARSMLESAARSNPGDDDDAQLMATIDSGWTAGEDTPRDLTSVAERARQRAERPHRSSRSASASPAPPPSDEDGGPSSRAGGMGTIALERGAEGRPDPDTVRRCAFMALTDLGNLERFLERFGTDFLYVEAWGWLAWDGKRWNRDMAMALLGRRIQETMRAIQDEAEQIRESGVPFPPEQGDLVSEVDEEEAAEKDEEKEAYTRQLFDEGEKKRLSKRSVLWYRQRQIARQTKHELPRHDYIAQVKSNGDIVLFSDKLAAWGRTSEGAGHISCIANMAEARLAARTEDFDVDPLALNVQNGTLIFTRPIEGQAASFLIRAHSRDDRITKIARATFDPLAKSPLFDAFLLRVQPEDDMREFLDRWAGYSGLGLADAQKMALFYGEGQNGKGVWVQTYAHLLGDYSWSTGIDTFMDADQKRTGGGPSPHLAALAGRRMVYANEPEDNSKFSDGLIKALTSDEPIGGVRELLKPPFEMTPSFNNTIMANTLPRIGTDFGIRRRMQVVPWGIIIPMEERDIHLKDKLKAEASGILNRLIRGALAYLTEGLNMPEASAEATREYHEENDMLAMFLDLCVARSPGDKIQSGALHALFVAWQSWAQQLPASGKPWSAKYLNAQMQRKGFKINKASTMQWHDIVARFDTMDFTDADGKPTTRELPSPRHSDKPSAGSPPKGVSAPPPDAGVPSVAPDARQSSPYEDDDLPP
jgi:putative DNA primase/helicase